MKHFFKRGLNSCSKWEEWGGCWLWVSPTSSLTSWPGCGRVGDCAAGHCVWGSAVSCHRTSASCARPSQLHSALGRGRSVPAAPVPSVWPQEALKVQNKINSLNPSNFLQSRPAGSRPMFCGLQWAFASVPRCLCFDDYIPKTCLWCFSVPTDDQNLLQWLQWSCFWP